MKRNLLFVLLALGCGLFLGTALGSGRLFASPAAASVSPAEMPVQSRMEREGVESASAPALDHADNTRLLERADAVVKALAEQDYEGLSRLIHPVRGVTLTPYSTVTPECDQVLTSEQVSGLAEDEQIYTWGVEDSTGAPIRLTIRDYFARFLENADYSQAPQRSVDLVFMQGNALENAADAYPEARFVEYHYPGLDPDMKGYDWCSLKVVLEDYGEEWYLVALVHSEWTI